MDTIVNLLGLQSWGRRRRKWKRRRVLPCYTMVTRRPGDNQWVVGWGEEERHGIQSDDWSWRLVIHFNPYTVCSGIW